MTDNEDKSQSSDQKIDTDDALWNYATRDVAPLENKTPNKKRTQNKNPNDFRPSFSLTEPAKRTLEKKEKGREVDHRTSERLRKGNIAIEGRLDLHGMTQNQAYDALVHFIPRMYADNKRCVLVITGKGKQYSDLSMLDQKTGVLKQKTPEWLNSAPLYQYVLKFEYARPKDGGDGALYVLLRRRRDI